MSTLRVTTIQNLSAVASYAAQAWVNFNGTGVPSILGQGNVSSITDNGVADYTVNFTTALADANYAAVLGAGYASNTDNAIKFQGAAFTTSSCRIVNVGTSYAEATINCLVVFR